MRSRCKRTEYAVVDLADSGPDRFDIQSALASLYLRIWRTLPCPALFDLGDIELQEVVQPCQKLLSVGKPWLEMYCFKTKAHKVAESIP